LDAFNNENEFMLILIVKAARRMSTGLYGLDCSLLGAIAMHYAHLGLGLGLGSGLGLALVFSET